MSLSEKYLYFRGALLIIICWCSLCFTPVANAVVPLKEIQKIIQQLLQTKDNANLLPPEEYQNILERVRRLNTPRGVIVTSEDFYRAHPIPVINNNPDSALNDLRDRVYYEVYFDYYDLEYGTSNICRYLRNLAVYLFASNEEAALLEENSIMVFFKEELEIIANIHQIWVDRNNNDNENQQGGQIISSSRQKD